MPESIDQVMKRISAGDKSAVPELVPLVYDDLRRLAARFMSRESIDHTFQPTALVHEVFLKLVDQDRVNWQGRTHFMAVSAQAMRRILVDCARAKLRDKRGGGRVRLTLRDDDALVLERPEEVVAIEEAVEALAGLDPAQAQVAEYRLFGGMEMSQIASVMNVSTRTVERQWAVGRAWLRKRLAES